MYLENRETFLKKSVPNTIFGSVPTIKYKEYSQLNDQNNLYKDQQLIEFNQGEKEIDNTVQEEKEDIINVKSNP